MLFLKSIAKTKYEKAISLFATLLFVANFSGQKIYGTAIPFQQEEYRWGGAVTYGSRMPYQQPVKEFDLAQRQLGLEKITTGKFN